LPLLTAVLMTSKAALAIASSANKGYHSEGTVGRTTSLGSVRSDEDAGRSLSACCKISIM
jgi:hypothetical protein